MTEAKLQEERRERTSLEKRTTANLVSLGKASMCLVGEERARRDADKAAATAALARKDKANGKLEKQL